MVTQEFSSSEEHIRKRLETLFSELQLIHAGIVVATGALRDQNSGRDIDVARVLKFCVGGRLFDQLDRTAELIASLSSVDVHPDELECASLR